MKNQLKELLILHFLNDGIRTTIIVLLPLIATDLSLSLAQVGFLGSSQPLLGALLALPTGFILGKFGGYKVILSLLLIYSIGVLGAAFAFNAPILFFTYLLAAVGFAMFHPAGFALTARVSENHNVGRNMSNFTAVGEIGRVALPPIALFIAAIIGWRITIGVIGAIGIILFLIAKLYFPQKDVYTLNTNKNTPENHKQFLKHAFSLFKNKKAARICIAAILDSIASSPIYVFLPFLLISKGSNPFQLSIAMGGFFVGSLIGKSLLGRYSDKLGQSKIFIFSEIIMAILLVLSTLFNEFLLLVLFSVLLGAFTKGTSPVVQSLFSKLTDKDHYHKVFAVSELLIAVASVSSIALLGIVADKSGVAFIFYICSAFAILASLPILIRFQKHH